MKNIFKKDKEKEKSHEGGQSGKEVPSIRARSSTNSPHQGSIHHSRKDSDNINYNINSSSNLSSPQNSSNINSSTGSNNSGSIGRASSQAQQQQQQQQQQQLQLQQLQQGIGSESSKKQHAIRIGDTRFYGRIICRAKALYDYPLDGDTLTVEDEEIKLLKFHKGDIINVYEQDSSGWWAGEFNDEKGIFPGSYMKVLEEEALPDQPKHKARSQNVAREELLNKISDLEAEREELIDSNDRERGEFNKAIKEIKAKAETEIQELRRLLNERDEVIQASAKKIRATEKGLEEVAAKLAAKEVEVLTMELEIQEYKNKLPDGSLKQNIQKPQDDRLSSNQLKTIQAEITAKSAELQEINRQKQEAEKGLRDAKAKLAALESQILRKVMTPQISDGSVIERGEDIDMLKKQLGEEVFEKRRMENEIREMKRLCVDVENLKTDKAKLELELASKIDLENKLSKIDTILLGVINKDPATLTVASIKELLTKVRKGIAASSNGLKSNSIINTHSGFSNESEIKSTTATTVNYISHGRESKDNVGRPKTGTFYKELH